MGNFQIDYEQLSHTIDDILREIHENEDTVELDEYRRIFKKNVSIFKRAYVAAYLMKYHKSALQQKAPSSSAMESVFMGIGKARRVFPRDIIKIILGGTDVKREEIGNIKVLDNYSFVDIMRHKAETVIQALNGQEYRGRTLNVNYAKKRN